MARTLPEGMRRCASYGGRYLKVDHPEISVAKVAQDLWKNGKGERGDGGWCPAGRDRRLRFRVLRGGAPRVVIMGRRGEEPQQ